MIRGDLMMNTQTRRRKPNMAALPQELGRRVIHEILSSPAPNRAALRAKAEEKEAQMIAARKNEKD